METAINSKQEIKKYANHYMYSDVNPFEVVRTISPITVEVRPMETVQTKMPKQFHQGGFSGHYSDNRSQEYEYTSNPQNPVKRIRWSSPKRNWYDAHGNKFLMEDLPSKFYDYNF